MNRELQLKHAKNSALLMYEKGYSQPISEKFLVQGNGLMGLVNVGANSMLAGNYISEHDQHISKKIGLGNVRWRCIRTNTRYRTIFIRLRTQSVFRTVHATQNTRTH
jgi:hypothetical protein